MLANKSSNKSVGGIWSLHWQYSTPNTPKALLDHKAHFTTNLFPPGPQTLPSHSSGLLKNSMQQDVAERPWTWVSQGGLWACHLQTVLLGKMLNPSACQL